MGKTGMDLNCGSMERQSGSKERRHCRAPKVANTKCVAIGANPLDFFPSASPSSHHPHRSDGQFMVSFSPNVFLFKNKHPTHRNTQEQWSGLYTIHQLSHFLHTADGEKRAPRQWRQQTLLLPPPFLLVRLVPVPLSLSLSLSVSLSHGEKKEGPVR